MEKFERQLMVRKSSKYRLEIGLAYEKFGEDGEKDKQVSAALTISLQLETIGIDADIALHQGFVIVEKWAYSRPMTTDQLVELQQDYLDYAELYFGRD